MNILKDELRLIIDTNRVFAALIRDSLTRYIILNFDGIFFAPDYVINEVEKHEEYLREKSGLDHSSFNRLFDMLLDRIEIVPIENIIPCFPEAQRIMDHIDPDDMIFIAIGLCSDNDGIWTEDKHFQKQDVLPVFSTKALLARITIN